jgi:CheY-like chemotaxis protein/signal transduction histidine kinase
VRSRLYLPVRVGGEVVGSIGFASSRPGSFGTQHQQALRFLCDLAGVTYARLQAQQEIERRGQLIEATATANERLLSALEWRQAATAALALVGNALDVAALALVKLEQDERAEQVDFVWQPLFGAPWRYRDRVARLEREERDKLARGLGVVITTARGDGDAPCTVECKPVLVDGVLWGVIACEATLGRAERAALRWLANGFAATIMRERMDRELRERHKVEAVSRLASGIAHDFNNLLWPVLLYSEILERGPGLDDRARQMLRDMRRSATRASELVQQVFAVSRSRDRVLQVVDVPEIAIEVAATARRSSPTAVHIVSTIDNDAGHVLGDEDSVRQLLQHLLAQSLDAASSADERAASGVIRLSVERLERDRGSWIRIVVRDESQAPAEDPIGMAIVRRLSTELGGEMTCERSAAGSVRELLLPIALREPSAPAEPEPTIDELVARANPTPSPDAERVLLVDDDAAVLEVARQILESLGYEVVACDTPERALTVLGDGALPLALLLTDLSMPGMDGIGLARECRRLRPQLPIVFCTGFGDTRSERAARELGAAAFIRKPIDFDHYAKTIRAAIEGSPRGGAKEKSGRRRRSAPVALQDLGLGRVVLGLAERARVVGSLEVDELAAERGRLVPGGAADGDAAGERGDGARERARGQRAAGAQQPVAQGGSAQDDGARERRAGAAHDRVAVGRFAVNVVHGGCVRIEAAGARNARRPVVDAVRSVRIPSRLLAIPPRRRHDAEVDRSGPESAHHRLQFTVLLGVDEQADVRDREEGPRRHRHAFRAAASENGQQLKPRRGREDQGGHPAEDLEHHGMQKGGCGAAGVSEHALSIGRAFVRP